MKRIKLALKKWKEKMEYKRLAKYAPCLLPPFSGYHTVRMPRSVCNEKCHDPAFRCPALNPEGQQLSPNSRLALSLIFLKDKKEGL